MSKLNITLPAVLAGLVLAGSAVAGPLQPAAGEAPFFNEPVAASQVSRAEVAAEAAAHLPAAGEMTASADRADRSSVLTRSQVRQATAEAGNELGHFPAASGMNS